MAQTEIPHTAIHIRQIVISDAERLAIPLVKLTVALAELAAQRLQLSHSSVHRAQIVDERSDLLTTIGVHEEVSEPGTLGVQFGEVRVFLHLLTPILHQRLERHVVFLIQ